MTCRVVPSKRIGGFKGMGAIPPELAAQPVAGKAPRVGSGAL